MALNARIAASPTFQSRQCVTVLTCIHHLCKIRPRNTHRHSCSHRHVISSLPLHPFSPLRWLAPECLLEDRFSSASDVWAFAVVLWEMFNNGATPHSSYTLQMMVEHWKHHPDQNPLDISSIPSNLHPLVQKCLNPNRANRPSFTELRESLNDYLPVHQATFGSATFTQMNPMFHSRTQTDRQSNDGESAVLMHVDQQLAITFVW
eukprot:m.317527 g.317527  ORF g.317527 m.317527 type:complete len:205 (-) comp15984_c0_seq6:385-999(-)